MLTLGVPQKSSMHIMVKSHTFQDGVKPCLVISHRPVIILVLNYNVLINCVKTTRVYSNKEVRAQHKPSRVHRW